MILAWIVTVPAWGSAPLEPPGAPMAPEPQAARPHRACLPDETFLTRLSIHARHGRPGDWCLYRPARHG